MAPHLSQNDCLFASEALTYSALNRFPGMHAEITARDECSKLGGGGGGTFVVFADNSPIIIASGGGGASAIVIERN